MAALGITEVCFRNDDVNDLTEELIRFTDMFTEREIPITHAIEPKNLTGETITWLKEMKRRYPELIEIVQHGWDHSRHGSGEFGGLRPYEDQYNDLRRGKERMESIFGKNFFPMITFPYGVYNTDTVKAADSLEYKVIGGRYDYRFSRQLFYFLGRTLRKGRLFGRYVSNHLRFFPETRLFEVGTAIEFVAKYRSCDDYEMLSAEEVFLAFEKSKKHTSVTVFLLHHSLYGNKGHTELVSCILDKLQMRKDVIFTNYARIYGKYAKAR